MTHSETYAERRQRQRFAALREGKPCIDVRINEQRLPVIDLSIDGFSIPAGLVANGDEFDFEMRLIDGFGDKVRGRARAVNMVGDTSSGQSGCIFLTLTETEQKTLQEWLTVIVICGASVRLTPHEAEAIVKGPSLI
ncbi:PilZ domain-containing protein [Uliginosibacterium sp. 31-16]|uniref:PilZ domain-containing protein n=1 Tax=Uliginosibacterium sp. 31-16 TaxID=3068315 RepID=UPI00273F8B9D|nr:PilZ domain-containing protein [Uliginosibacterium sp. 31-16]MDP5239692.1 PilZ domain-containing protein [Uliginosibacterium sp. 31-16]